MDLPYGGVIRGPLFSDQHTSNVMTRCRKGDRIGALEVPHREHSTRGMSLSASTEPLRATPTHLASHRRSPPLRHYVEMERYEELTDFRDEQLIAIFNQDRQNVSAGKQWFIDEITRRRTDRATEALVGLTRQLAVLTVVIALLTAVGATASVVAALRSG